MSLPAENPAPLARLSKAVLMLAEARTLKEVRHVKAMAEAAEQYARAEKLGQEAVEYALEVKFLAARKAGEILIQMEQTGERRERGKSHVPAENMTATLSDLGVTRKESMNWQSLARLDEKKFAAALPRLVKGESVSSVIPPRRPARPGWDAESMRRRGAIRSLCEGLVALGAPDALAKELTAHDDAEACLALIESAWEWLGRLRKELRG